MAVKLLQSESFLGLLAGRAGLYRLHSGDAMAALVAGTNLGAFWGPTHSGVITI